VKDLFRQEVVEASRGEWLGTILLVNPLSRWLMTWLAVSFALVLILFFAFGRYTHREVVIGQLIPTATSLTVATPSAGIITRLEVRGGQAVKVGDILAELTNYRGSAAAGNAQESLDAAAKRDEAERTSEGVVQSVAQSQDQRTVILRAPYDGVVSTVLLRSGQSVSAGQPLLSILPANATLQAQLLIPGRAIGRVEQGDRIVLRYEAFPYQKFGHYYGHVLDISRDVLSDSEVAALMGQQPAQGSESLYRVLVSLDSQQVTAYGKSQPLRAGMLVDADIATESRSLLEWAFKPLYGMADHFSGRTHA
jgi:multidrug efflux pump subunit AcrA (membrane-fusion protein)